MKADIERLKAIRVRADNAALDWRLQSDEPCDLIDDLRYVLSLLTLEPGGAEPPQDAPPFDLAHKMQRVALDTAWQKYGHDAEHRERLTTWLREHGLAIWKLVQASGAGAAPPPAEEAK